MGSNKESFVSTLTSFFTSDIFKRFLQKRQKGKTEIYIRSGDGEDEERGMGCWRLEMANTNDNHLDRSTELKRAEAQTLSTCESLNCGVLSFKQTSFRGSQNRLQKVSCPSVAKCRCIIPRSHLRELWTQFVSLF